jgi:cytochrome c oxidase subunit 4
MEQASQRPLMVKVWIGLLALTLAEVVLAYVQLAPGVMLTLLMVFSVVKATMIAAYFMHLKFDRPALGWMLMPAFVAMVVVLLAYLLPDGYLLLHNRP